MQEIADFLSANPLFLLPLAFLLAIVGYALVKRLLKMALFLIVFVGIYAGLVYILA